MSYFVEHPNATPEMTTFSAIDTRTGAAWITGAATRTLARNIARRMIDAAFDARKIDGVGWADARAALLIVND